MATTARLDLSVWRNDDVYEYPLRVRGLDLTNVVVRMQVRLTPDTPGAPLVDLGKVSNPNAEGIRVAGVTMDAGVPVSDVRIRINKSTRQALPYAGEVGDAARLSYMFQIAGRTRLIGNLLILAHTIDSDSAPTNRLPGLGCQAIGSPAAGSTLTIMGDEVTQLTVDGADIAVAAQGAAESARDIALNAADTALASGRYFTTRPLGEAGSTAGQLFSTDDGAGNLIFYRKTSGDSVEIGRALTPASIASAAGASLVGTKLVATGSVARTQADANADTIDVWDFMTPAMKASVEAGDLSVDTAPAFQAAIDFASGKALNSSGHGRRVTFRGGTYRWNTPVTFSWRGSSSIIDAGDMRRPTLTGDGSANTVIFYTGPAGTPALTIAGHSGGANGGVDLFMALRGFWLRRIFGSAQTGTGIRFDQASFVALDDVGVDQFDRNLDIIDTIRFHAIGCRFTGATESIYARVSVFSHPNVFTFDRCDFGGNFKRIARFATPANVVFADCGMEGNGDGTDHLVQINGGPQEGGCALELRGGYIENNFALSEIYLNWSAANNSGTARISGVSFNKTGNTRLVTNHILVSAEPPSAGRLRVSIDGCAFKGFSYTPSASRPAVAQTSNSANALVSITNCHYDFDAERPQFNGWPAHGDGYSQLAASVRFAADGTLSSQWNVASISKVNVGEYAITYKQPLRAAPVHMTWGKIGPGVTDAYVKSESTTQCVIVTTDGAGVAADRAISVRLHGLLN